MVAGVARRGALNSNATVEDKCDPNDAQEASSSIVNVSANAHGVLRGRTTADDFRAATGD